MSGQIALFLHRMLPGAALAALLWAAAYPLRRRRLAKMGLRSARARELVLLLFVMFCGGMAILTLTPPGFDLAEVLRGEYAGPFFSRGPKNLQLFVTFRYSKVVLLGNVLMFVPFGFVPAVLWRRGRWYRALAIAAGVTLGIECWQLQIGRSFDVDDLLLNALGGMCGWFLWLAAGRPALYCEER